MQFNALLVIRPRHKRWALDITQVKVGIDVEVEVREWRVGVGILAWCGVDLRRNKAPAIGHKLAGNAQHAAVHERLVQPVFVNLLAAE